MRILALALLLVGCHELIATQQPSQSYGDIGTPAFDVSCSRMTCTFSPGATRPAKDGRVFGWTFGDASLLLTRQTAAAHVYEEPGTYVVRLNVFDNDVDTELVQRKVTVTG